MKRKESLRYCGNQASQTKSVLRTNKSKVTHTSDHVTRFLYLKDRLLQPDKHFLNLFSEFESIPSSWFQNVKDLQKLLAQPGQPHVLKDVAKETILAICHPTQSLAAHFQLVNYELSVTVCQASSRSTRYPLASDRHTQTFNVKLSVPVLAKALQEGWELRFTHLTLTQIFKKDFTPCLKPSVLHHS